MADLHLTYEDAAPYAGLKWETQEPVSFKVEKMRLKGESKPGEDDERTWKTYERLQVNDTLTITGIPAAAFAYRLGNRSALEWVVDQYQVKMDKRSGIESDPNAYGDERYIVDLVEKVITVSVKTVEIVDALARWRIV